MSQLAKASSSGHQLIKKQFDEYRKSNRKFSGYPEALKKQAVSLIESGCSVDDVMSICGVSRFTVYQWKNHKRSVNHPPRPRCVSIAPEEEKILSIASNSQQSTCQIKFSGGTEAFIPLGSILREVILAIREAIE